MRRIKLYGNKKREKGAITLFVLLACLFFVFILTGVYLSNLNRMQVQEQEVQQIRDNYAKDLDRIEEIYDNLAKTMIVTLKQEPENGTWTKEVTLIGYAKVDEESTATILEYIFNQESTKSGSTSWSWKTVSGTNIKELTEQEKVTNNEKYYFWVKDSEGEIHRSNEIEVKDIDKNNPTAGTLIAKEQNEDGTESDYDLIKSPWTDKDVKVEKVDGTDGEGKTETVYTILKNGVEYEGSVTNPKTEPTTLTETGEYTVTVITTDKVGNTAEREYTIKIDKVVPILALKHNDENGAEYEQGTWTKDNLYGEINLDTSKTGKEVEKYQYSENGVIWKDITEKITQSSIDYTTTFPMSSDKPEWITGPINNGTYYFEVQADGTLKPNNSGKNNTTANSYFEIDLTNQPNATLEIIINATISSQIWSDYGYATITTSSGAPAYNDSNGRFIYEAGSTSTGDYSTTITGGQKYYLHIGYRKDFLTAMYQDAFIINRITLKSDNLTKELNFYNFNKSENTVTFNFKEEMEKEIYVRAVYTDGKITKYGDKTSVKIDKVAPIIESANPTLISREEAKADIKATDKSSGLKGYYISTDQTTPTENSDWIAQTMNEFTIENLNANTTYYLWTIDNAGNISERKEVVIGTANYIVDNRTTTETLAEAISVANDGSIIKLLGDYTDTSTATFSKNVTFDVQSYTLTREATITIDSGKTVEIAGTGKITSRTSNISTITNNGTLTLSDSIIIENNSTSVNNAPIYSNSSSAITSINDNTQIIGYYRGIYNNYGTLNLNGGKIEATNQSSSAYGIYNYSSSSKTYITNGEIKGYYGIYNGSSSTVEMTGGKVIGTGAEGIYAYGTTNVYGGKIEGKTYGICGYATNKVTIGRETDELSTTNPAIYGGNYGVYMNSTSYGFNFYNGVIISNTKETAYRGVLNPRINHMTYTYFEYDVEQKYCTVLTPVVERITMQATPTEFTNRDVTVRITYPNNTDTRQYSEDGTTWQEAEDYVQEVIVTENKIIYARTINTSGVVTDEAQIEITNIDKEVPTVNVSPSETNYIVSSSNETVDLVLTLTANDTGVSGLDRVQYAWVEDGEEINYIDFDSTGTTITENNLEIGQYYLYFYVTDKAGNRANLQQIRYNVKLGDPVCKIGDTTYTTIQAAVEACSKTAGDTQTTIEMLKSTDEEFETYEGQNIILDLKGYTVGSSSLDIPLCTNNGTLRLIDTSSNKTGKLESLNGTTIENNGTFTLGDNSTSIEMEVPTIYGYQIGIENNNIFNFYDGKIQGITPVQGSTTDTPEQYGPVSTRYDNGITTIQLGIVDDYEARIEWVYYTKLQNAINITKLYQNDYKDTVTIVKDIQLTDILEISENKDFILDLNGYTLTTAEQDRVINNNGNLEITDSSIEQTGNIIIESTSICYGIYNYSGTTKIAGGTINSSSTSTTCYGIYNASNGIIEVNGGNINCNSGRDSYAIYNVNIGKIKVEGGNINSNASQLEGIGNAKAYGIYNAGNGIVDIKSIDITNVAIDNSGDSYCYGIYNQKNGAIQITDGSIMIINEGNHSSFSYGIYNENSGNIEIMGGAIINNSNNSGGNNNYDTSYGIYNENSGNIEIKSGTIISKSINRSCYGIYNMNTGTVTIGEGTVSSETANQGGASYAIYNVATGRIEIIKGMISGVGEGSRNYGIYNQDIGTIIIGKEDSLINIEQPKIVGEYKGTKSSYSGIGLYNKIGNIEFNNGIIQGNISLSGNITKVKKGYQIEKSPITGEKESIYLVKKLNTENIVQIDGIKYNSLQAAINSIEENEEKTIQVIKEFELNEPIEFNKNVIIDLNSYTITNNYYSMQNSKNLKITDIDGGTGKIEANNTMIGILNLESGKIEIMQGEISSISRDNIEDSYGIYNINGTVEIKGGIVNSNNIANINKYSYGIYNNNGTVKMTGGTIRSDCSDYRVYSYGIYNFGGGTVEFIGGTIYSSSKGYNYGIYNYSGLVKIIEGIISCNGYDNPSYGIYNLAAGNIIIEKVAINVINYTLGTTYGIYNTGTATIEKGTVNVISSRASSYGIYNGNTGSITIGVKEDGLVLQEEPYVKAECSVLTNNYVSYGVYNTTGKFYFYDGKIEGTTKAVYDIITEYEDNTELNYNENETILTLSTTLTPVAQIGNTTYNTLQEAINAVGSSQTTIELLRNVAYTKNDTVITIPNGKNIILDLNGYKISSAIPGETIQNNGTLEITDTSTGQAGTIVTNEEQTITNANGASLTISGGIIDNRDNQVIYNEGFVEISGGEIVASNYGIYNYNNGNIMVTGGTITGNSYNSTGIYNNSIGSVEMEGGTITNTRYGIYNAKSGTIEVSRGTINSNYSNYSNSSNYGIYNNSAGTIIVGNKGDGVVSKVDPTILATNASSSYTAYGIYNPNGALNYYDGKIQGKTKAIYGNIAEVEDLTEINISSETISSSAHETLTLQPKTTNVARVNGVEYDSIEKAVKACGTSTNTITILRNSDPGATVIIEKNQNITIDLKGYTINNYTELQNKGTLKIKDSSSGQTGKVVGLIGMAISNTGTMELQGGSIADSGYGIKNTGILIVNGGNISNNTYGIYNDGSGTTTVENGNITSNTYGIYNYSGTTKISGTAITGNDYGLYNAGGTTAIKEGTEVQSDIGIYVAGGRVNIGETETMNSSSPIITGETYGLSVTSTGIVYMYDGQIKGKQGATQGFITYTETGYAVANKVEGEYFVDYLALAGTIDAVAEVNGISYSNLQSAINSIVGTEPQTIKLTNGIITSAMFTVAEGQNIILDMNEKTISSDLDVTINNAGNLTIIDSTGSGVGKISSTTGTAIVNSGTLTLGQDDGTVSQDLITIEGNTYGIENTGTLNFYDGTINGGSAVNGTITNRATGYVIRITTLNGKERYYLST